MTTTQTPLTVSEFLDTTNEVLAALSATVQGEITSLKVYPKAVYFNLTDPTDKAVLNCMAWRSQVESFGIQLKEGLTVQVFGRAEIYKPSGRFSFLARSISPVGEGALKAAFEALKKKLAGAGYFDETHKQPLPLYPQNIGLITSARGAAIDDFRTHLIPMGLHVTLCDVVVQGPQAVDSLVHAIRWFNQQPNPVEVIVITRGGGSLEDLQPFNAERVAQAIFASRIPIISAVGHEQDVSISDLVADVRASTPTAAAKTLSLPWLEARHHVQRYATSMVTTIDHACRRTDQTLTQTHRLLLHAFATELTMQRHQLEHMSLDFGRAIDRISASFIHLSNTYTQNINRLTYKLDQTHTKMTTFALQITQHCHHHYRRHQQHWQQLHDLLQANDPEQKLKQGYSLIFTSEGKLVRHLSQLKMGDRLTNRLHDGQMTTTVTELPATTT